MKLFVLTNNPERPSFRQRIGVYLDTLRANGINCDVAKLPSGELARRRLFRRAKVFDGVLLQKKGLNPLDAMWLRKYSKKIIYDFDDAVMYSDKHPDRLSRKRHKSFQRTVKLSDMVIAGNSYLAKHALKFNSSVEIIPTGLGTNACKLQAHPKKNDTIYLVWIGSRSTLKYLAEIKPALEEIGSNFDNVVLRIISTHFLDLQMMDVEKCLWSEQTQDSDLIMSDIGLAPLPDNLFTRGKCGHKILEYAAAGLPVVASPVGVNSEYVREGVNGFLAGNCSEWIDKISRLVRDPQLREQMGRTGRTNVERFDFKVLGKQLINLVKGCL